MKNTAKISLLLLLGAAQQSLEAKPEVAKKMAMPTTKQVEKEKKRAIYHAIIEAQKKGDPRGLPQFELLWSSLPPVKNVTEAQVAKAKHEYEMQNAPAQKLCDERNDYLMHKYPAYAELQKLETKFVPLNENSPFDKFCNDHRKELMAVFSDDMNLKEILTAQEKAAPYFFKYQQLQIQYDREHPQFHGPAHRPYLEEKELTAARMKKEAKDAEKIALAPGKSFELPMLNSGNGTAANPELVNSYSLALLDGKNVSGDIAALATKTITNKNPMPGAAATTYENRISAPKHAKLGTKFYVLEHHLDGSISVYAMVTIGKEKAAVAPMAKKVKKAAPSKPAKMTKQAAKPVAKAKHISGKKAAN